MKSWLIWILIIGYLPCGGSIFNAEGIKNFAVWNEQAINNRIPNRLNRSGIVNLQVF